MTSDAKFRNWRKSRDPREIELRRKFHVSSEISYFSEEKKAALENVIQFFEFLTVHNSCFRCLDKNQRRDREPWNIVKSDHVKKTDDSTGTRLSREIRRDEKANNKRDDSTNRRSGTIVEQLERRHSFDVPRASTNYAGAQNWIIDSRYQATESIARVLPSWSTFSSHPHPPSLPLKNFSIRLDQFIPPSANLLSLPPLATFSEFQATHDRYGPSKLHPPREATRRRRRRQVFNRPKDVPTHRFSKLLRLSSLISP